MTSRIARSKPEFERDAHARRFETIEGLPRVRDGGSRAATQPRGQRCRKSRVGACDQGFAVGSIQRRPLPRDQVREHGALRRAAPRSDLRRVGLESGCRERVVERGGHVTAVRDDRAAGIEHDEGRCAGR